MFRSIHVGGAWAGLLLLVTPAMQLYAEENLLQTSVYTRAEHNDNIFLVDDDPRGSTSMSVIPSLRYALNTETWRASLQGKAKISRYNQENLDGEDVFFSSRLTYAQPRDVFALNVNYDLTSNLNTESSDFGLTRVRSDRDTFRAGPEYTRNIGDRMRLQLSGNQTEVDYDSTAAGFVPYRTRTAGATIAYDIDEITDMTLSVQTTDYKSKSGSSEYDLLTTQIGLDHEFSERTKLSLSIGVTERDSIAASQPIIFFGVVVTPAPVRSLTTNAVYRFQLSTELSSTATLGLNAKRTDQSNSFGGLNEVEKFNVSYSDKLSRELRWEVLLSHANTVSQTVGVEFSDRQTRTVEVSMTRNFTRQLNLIGSYRYLNRNFDNNVAARTKGANVLYLEMRYRFNNLEL